MQSKHHQFVGWLLAFFVACLDAGPLPVGRAEETSSAEEERLLRYYTGTRGLDVAPLGKLGPKAILRMAESLRNPDEPRKGAILQALAKAIEVMSAPDEVEAQGKAAIYPFLKSESVPFRHIAAEALKLIDGEGATDRWLELLRDPDESIRVVALGLLQGSGRPDVWPQIEKIVAERARGLTAEQIRRDGTFQFGEIAISRLKLRNEGRSMDWILEQEEKAELERLKHMPPDEVPRVAVVRSPPTAPTPAPSTPIATATPAPSSPGPTVATTPAPVVARKSLVWPWVVGIVTLIVIVAVALKRRA